MDTKISKELNREKLAEVLEEIAGALRAGTFELDSHLWPVPAALDVKLKHKEKKGRIKTRIEWQWSTLADYETAAREEVERWKDSFKNAKKRLSRTFKAMRKEVQGGRIPSDNLLDAFMTDSKFMDEVADPDWKEALEEYRDHLANLETAVKNGQLEAVAHELRDLGVRMKDCHREFK
jgi:XXXCH domain-containing protein